MDANLICFQSWVFWEPQDTLVGILKARILVVWFKPFTPQGEAPGLSSLPTLGSAAPEVGFMAELQPRPSYPLSCGPSLLLPDV